MANFTSAIAHVLHWEGGDQLTNDPGDSGGCTKFGISQKAYPDVDIPGLTEEDALAIYRRDYWDPIGGDAIPDQGIADVLMDAAVNMGRKRAVMIAQAIVGAAVDGIVGPQTLGRLALAENFVNEFSLYRSRYYLELVEQRPELRKFYFGWMRRALSFVKGA